MPHFYFDVHDGVERPDRTGKVFPDLATAQIEAVVLAGILLVENPTQFWNGAPWSIDIRDDFGTVLFELQFTARESAQKARRLDSLSAGLSLRDR